MSKENNMNRVDTARNTLIETYNLSLFFKTLYVLQIGLIQKITYAFRDPQELRHDITGSTSSQKFYRYMNAARHGQDGGDCLKTYPCHSDIE